MSCGSLRPVYDGRKCRRGAPRGHRRGAGFQQSSGSPVPPYRGNQAPGWTGGMSGVQTTTERRTVLEDPSIRRSFLSPGLDAVQLQFLPGLQRCRPSLGGVGGSLKAGRKLSVLGLACFECPSVHVPTQQGGRSPRNHAVSQLQNGARDWLSLTGLLRRLKGVLPGTQLEYLSKCVARKRSANGDSCLISHLLILTAAASPVSTARTPSQLLRSTRALGVLPPVLAWGEEAGPHRALINQQLPPGEPGGAAPTFALPSSLSAKQAR